MEEVSLLCPHNRKWMAKIFTQKEIKNWNKIRERGLRKYQAKKVLVPVVKKKSVVLKPKPKKVYVINKVSKSEKERQKKYRAIIKELKRLPENQICHWPRCTEPAQDCHHGLGRVGKYLFIIKWLKFLCRPHHIYAEMNPEEAKMVGISFSRLAN